MNKGKNRKKKRREKGTERKARAGEVTNETKMNLQRDTKQRKGYLKE